MKKYVKPELFYERYELSKHIADCDWELTYNDGGCKATADPEIWGQMSETLFTSALGCDFKTDKGEYSNYCYQNGSDMMKVAVS